jgi:thiol:disulfide interchange protein DsbG
MPPWREWLGAASVVLCLGAMPPFAARNPSLALDRNERQWARLPGDLGGGIPPLQRPKPATVAALRANEQFMHDLGLQGTPALMYRSGDHVMHAIQSASDPAKLKSIVSAAAPD